MARRIKAFDDSRQKDRRRATRDPSSDTSETDAYRQGVELTTPSHFANGIAKIHDGYNDQSGEHGIPQMVYGQERPILRDENSFRDDSKFDPAARFASPPRTGNSYVSDFENTNAKLLEDVASADGAVEPLEIRDLVTGRMHPKDVAHKMWGALDEGNINDRASSEVFVTEVKRDDLHVGSFPFVDESDVIGTLPIASESISPDHRRHGAFCDNQENNGIIVDELTMESDMLHAVRAMRPPSGNVLPPTFVQAGATGFDYGTSASGPSSKLSYEFQRPPVTITSVTPAFVPDGGGQTATIKGTGFLPGAVVLFGTTVAGGVVVVDSQTVTATVPAYAGLSGEVSVTVRNLDGMQATSYITYLENDMMNGFRLTLVTGAPVADSAPAVTIYMTPYLHGRIALFDGSLWNILTSAETSIAIGVLSSDTNYDVFAYNNAGALTLEFSAAWASDTARTDALARQDGVLVKSADHTRRYIGTFRTDSVNSTRDTTAKRFLYNYYNQVDRAMAVVDTTNTWTYANPNQVWRQVRAAATNLFEYVAGDDSTGIMARAYGQAFASAAAVGNEAAVGIGIDSTTVNSATIYGGNPNSTTLFMPMCAEYRGLPGLGYHKVNWLETGVGGAVTYTFGGDNNTLSMQTGMIGSIRC